jgi:hypothetical protein
MSGDPHLKRGEEDRPAPAGNKKEVHRGPPFPGFAPVLRPLPKQPDSGAYAIQDKERGKLGDHHRNFRRIRVIHQERDHPFGINFRYLRINLQEYLQIFEEFGNFSGFGHNAVLNVIVRIDKIRFLGKNGMEDKG